MKNMDNIAQHDELQRLTSGMFEHLHLSPPKPPYSPMGRPGQKTAPSRVPHRPVSSGAAHYFVRRYQPNPERRGLLR